MAGASRLCAQAPKWIVRTRDNGQWTARHICLTKADAASRWGHLIATGRVADVVPPREASR